MRAKSSRVIRVEDAYSFGTCFAKSPEGIKLGLDYCPQDTQADREEVHEITITKEMLRKYEIKDEKEIQKIYEAMGKAKTIKMKKGALYKIYDGVFIGVDRKGSLRIYLA